MLNKRREDNLVVLFLEQQSHKMNLMTQQLLWLIKIRTILLREPSEDFSTFRWNRFSKNGHRKKCSCSSFRINSSQTANPYLFWELFNENLRARFSTCSELSTRILQMKLLNLGLKIVYSRITTNPFFYKPYS